MRCDLFYWHFSRRWIRSFFAVTLNWSGMASPWVNEQGFWKGRDFLLGFQIILRSPNAISQALYPKPCSWHENSHFQMAQGLSACTTSLSYRSNTTRKREIAVDWVGERRRSTLAIPFTSSWFMICMSKYDLAYVYVMTLLRWYMATFWHIVQTYSKAKTANNQMLSSKILGSLSDLVQTNKIYHNDII